MGRDPRIDAYIEQAAPFARPILMRMRDLFHQTIGGLDETMKWSMPTFVYRGKNLAGLAAFKAHAAVMIHGDGRQGEAMGQFGKLRGLEDLPDAGVLSDKLREAARRIDEQGTALKKKAPAAVRAPKPELPVPDDLRRALDGNEAASTFFGSLAPSHRREYIEWLIEARRAETREKRLGQAISQLAEGKKRNWKYEGC